MAQCGSNNQKTKNKNAVALEDLKEDKLAIIRIRFESAASFQRRQEEKPQRETIHVRRCSSY